MLVHYTVYTPSNNNRNNNNNHFFVFSCFSIRRMVLLVSFYLFADNGITFILSNFSVRGAHQNKRQFFVMLSFVLSLCVVCLLFFFYFSALSPALTHIAMIHMKKLKIIMKGTTKMKTEFKEKKMAHRRRYEYLVAKHSMYVCVYIFIMWYSWRLIHSTQIETEKKIEILNGIKFFPTTSSSFFYSFFFVFPRHFFPYWYCSLHQTCR